MDQKTGQVKAIAGGRGEKTASLTLNRASNTLRQPGSTFKVLTAVCPRHGYVRRDAGNRLLRFSFHGWQEDLLQLVQLRLSGYSSIRDGIIYSMNSSLRSAV